jgi:hypothetical protein
VKSSVNVRESSERVNSAAVHVFRYGSGSTPTVPWEVTPATPLEELNLNWGERDLPESVRTKHVHRLHPYLGKYIPQLVEVFLRKYFLPGQHVADPFAGSGTTLVQANELGIQSTGFDISAFNVLLARAKVTKYDPLLMKSEIQKVISSSQVTFESDHTVLPGLLSKDSEGQTHIEASEYLRAWFHPRALRQLLAFRKEIEGADPAVKDLLYVILCRAARSARLTTHFDLDFPKRPTTEPYYCHKHSRICKPTEDAGKFLRRYAQDTVRRVTEFNQLRTNAPAEMVHGDSRQASLPQVNGVITSPPYVGLIDYHAQHQYAYHLLGLKDYRTQEIGSATAGTSAAAKAKYVEDIVSVFERTLDVMPTGGPLIIIAADRHGLYPVIASKLAVAIEAEIQRHVNRRTGRRGSAFYESVFVWRKL